MINATNSNVRNGQDFNQNAAAKEQQGQAQQQQSATSSNRKGAWAHMKDRREARKAREGAVERYVNGDTRGTTLGALARPASAQQSQSDSNAKSLHALAHDVIKYTHTGLHAHAVKSSNARSALNAVNEMIGLVHPYATGERKNSTLAHDERRLTRHQKHLQKKLSNAHTGHVAKGEEKAPEKAAEKAPTKCEDSSSSSSSICNDKVPQKAHEKAPEKAPEQAEKSPEQAEKSPEQAEKSPEQAEKSPEQADQAPENAERAPEQASEQASEQANEQTHGNTDK